MPTGIQQPPFKADFLGKDGRVQPASQWGYFITALQIATASIAPVNATYIVATSDTTLSNEVNLGALATGFLSITVSAGTATVTSAATISAAVLTGTLPALSGVNLTNLTGANLTYSVVSKTFTDTGYVALNAQTVAVNATGGATTVKFPATPSSGDWSTFIKTDAGVNAVTVDGNGHNINGSATASLLTQYKTLTGRYDGSQWLIVAAA